MKECIAATTSSFSEPLASSPYCWMLWSEDSDSSFLALAAASGRGSESLAPPPAGSSDSALGDSPDFDPPCLAGGLLCCLARGEAALALGLAAYSGSPDLEVLESEPHPTAKSAASAAQAISASALRMPEVRVLASIIASSAPFRLLA
jgi:hypothetical protein